MHSLHLTPGLDVSPADIEDVALRQRPVTLDDTVVQAAHACNDLLDRARNRGERIYGLTTGFGPLVTEPINLSTSRELQQNLIYHLASGTGPLLPPHHARALMIARLLNLSRGHSAVRPDTLKLLVTWLNEDITPAIPSLGSVGASGDLTPLAHLALAMMGEGQILTDRGPLPAAPYLAEHRIPLLELHDRDGLAIVNGTSATLGLASLAQQRARRAFDCALDLGALFLDLLAAQKEALDPFLAQVRPHTGQYHVTQALRTRLQGSQRLRTRFHPPHPHVQALFNSSPLPLQDAYSLRCIPQLLGAVHDQLTFHHHQVHRELQGVSDNPLFDPANDRIVHGGNFFGQHLAMASDTLNQAVITQSVLIERQIARLTDRNLSPFPAFMQPNQLGLQSGMMGAQVTASSLVAHLRSRATPLAIQSVPTNANNQDVNPMATLSALESHNILDRAFELLAILTIATLQAAHLEDAKNRLSSLSPRSQQLFHRLAPLSPPLHTDRPLSAEILAIATHLALP